MIDIDNMTATDISAAIKNLPNLGKLGKITPAQAMRLDLLEAASRNISRATRRRREWMPW